MSSLYVLLSSCFLGLQFMSWSCLKMSQGFRLFGLICFSAAQVLWGFRRHAWHPVDLKPRDHCRHWKLISLTRHSTKVPYKHEDSCNSLIIFTCFNMFFTLFTACLNLQRCLKHHKAPRSAPLRGRWATDSGWKRSPCLVAKATAPLRGKSRNKKFRQQLN